MGYVGSCHNTNTPSLGALFGPPCLGNKIRVSDGNAKTLMTFHAQPLRGHRKRYIITQEGP